MLMNDLQLFTETQGALLIKIIIAHLIADFFLQSKEMVQNKKWLSKSMAIHIAIVFVMTLFVTKLFYLSLVISVLHYGIDGLKIELLKRIKSKSFVFLFDQALHFIIIIACWGYYLDITDLAYQAFFAPLVNYKLSLIVLGYIAVTTPMGYCIGLITKRYQNKGNNETKTDQNGFLIGIFERLIIFSFLLIGEYAAIGFLITGKSIIRFSTKNEDIKSEYVLLGTFMSYAMTIVFGLIIKSLL